jgi:hypothetical protein
MAPPLRPSIFAHRSISTLPPRRRLLAGPKQRPNRLCEGQRDNRILQLRLFSFGIITGVVSFVQIDVVAFPFALTILAFTLLSLCAFDAFYDKITRQVTEKIQDLAKAQPTAEFQFFAKPNRLHWRLSFDHLWYVFIFMVASAILFLKAVSTEIG